MRLDTSTVVNKETMSSTYYLVGLKISGNYGGDGKTSRSMTVWKDKKDILINGVPISSIIRGKRVKQLTELMLQKCFLLPLSNASPQPASTSCYSLQLTILIFLY